MANIWQNFLSFDAVLSPNQMYETRIENNVAGQPIYVAICLTPNGDPDALIWFIIKLHYDGGGELVRSQLPDGGVKFAYSNTQRATYFT